MLLAGIVFAIALFAFEAARYLGLGAYLDHIEGNIIISGWQWAQGQPLYGLEDGAPRFATFYGPLAYLGHLPALLLIGPGIAASKAMSIAAALVTIPLMGWHFLRRAPSLPGLDAVLMLSSGLLLFSPMSFWVRPDPVETVLVAAAIAARAKPGAIGVCAGLAINLKAHAFLYFLPIMVELGLRLGWRGPARAALCAAVTFAAPFCLPGISATDYLTALGRQVGLRGQSAAQLLPVLVGAALLSLPLLLPLARGAQASSARLYGWTTLATLALLLYPATFSGAGAYHFLPLLPVLVEARYRLQASGIAAQIAPFLILAFAWLPAQHALSVMTERAGWAGLAEETLGLARQSPDRPAQVGYGDNRRSYEISQLSKTRLSLAGFPALVDAQVLMELRQVGIDGSRRWVPYLEQCRIRAWLLPTGEEPFAIRSYFYDDAPLFGEAFRRAFFAHYRRTRVGPHYELWSCGSEPP
ncbi:MAG: hypothetical protein JO267_06145 [Alphaproteobacteria bacterium]|nr:hypothetical protein [Alphaproteobacteria bacterium]